MNAILTFIESLFNGFSFSEFICLRTSNEDERFVVG